MPLDLLDDGDQDARASDVVDDIPGDQGNFGALQALAFSPRPARQALSFSRHMQPPDTSVIVWLTCGVGLAIDALHRCIVYQLSYTMSTVIISSGCTWLLHSIRFLQMSRSAMICGTADISAVLFDGVTHPA